MAKPDMAYSTVLQHPTQLEARTGFTEMDEHHDIPAVMEAQSEAGRQWPQEAHFLDAPEHDATWATIRRKWVSFLSTTSDSSDPTSPRIAKPCAGPLMAEILPPPQNLLVCFARFS